MKGQNESKRDSRSRERGVLTEVAQKVGTAVGTVVSALSRTSGQGSKKTTTGGSSSHSPGAKASRQRSGNQPAKAETEHSPLKRRRRRSKSTK